jgi:hypothetical protein
MAAAAEATSSGDHTSGSGGAGKVRVILRVANGGSAGLLPFGDSNEEDSQQQKKGFFRMDQKKKQVTLLDPNSGINTTANNIRLEETDEELKGSGGCNGLDDRQLAETSLLGTEGGGRTLDVTAPKMFAFDGLFTDADPQSEVAAAALTDILQAVVSGGADGTLFCFGHGNLGKSYTMIGRDESSRTVGVTPTAIAWLFRCIKERKEKTTGSTAAGGGGGVRFSLRVSALEIVGSGEELRDLLVGHGSEPSGNQFVASLLHECGSSSVYEYIFTRYSAKFWSWQRRGTVSD